MVTSAHITVVAPDLEEDDLALIRRALASESDAVDTLVRRLMPVVRARVFRAIARGGKTVFALGADDLVQEIWLSLIANDGRQLLAYAPDRGMSLEGYVGMVSEREIGNRRQKASAKKRGGHLKLTSSDALETTESPLATPEEITAANDLAARLDEHLEDNLPARSRAVLRGAFENGDSASEVAEEMGVKVQVVYNWQHKIRELARAFLKS